MIKNIFKGNIVPGYHSFDWDGTNELGTTVSAGLYFMSIRSDYLVQTKKMMFLK
jgi:flagellar hook assembly protein FlgD